MNQLASKILELLLVTSFLLPMQDPAWKKVDHSKYSFSYPAKWDLHFRKDSSKGFTIKLPGKYPPSIQLEVYYFDHKKDLEGVPVHYGDQESYADFHYDSSIIDSIKGDSVETIPIPSANKEILWKRISIDTLNIDGQEYIEAIHLIGEDEFTTKRIWRIYNKGNRRYNLRFGANTKIWRSYESDILRVFDSFKLK